MNINIISLHSFSLNFVTTLNSDDLNRKVIELEKKKKLEKDFIEQIKKLDNKLDQWVYKRILEMKIRKNPNI